MPKRAPAIHSRRPYLCMTERTVIAHIMSHCLGLGKDDQNQETTSCGLKIRTYMTE